MTCGMPRDRDISRRRESRDANKQPDLLFLRGLRGPERYLTLPTSLFSCENSRGRSDASLALTGAAHPGLHPADLWLLDRSISFRVETIKNAKRFAFHHCRILKQAEAI